MKKRILIAAHRHPAMFEPRGGENSVRIIAEHLHHDRGHSVRVVTTHGAMGRDVVNNIPYIATLNPDRYINPGSTDVVLTWGSAAPEAGLTAASLGIPYILMVRWWRLLLPDWEVSNPDDMMTRTIDTVYTRRRRNLFYRAYAVVTNDTYSKWVIERFYPGTAAVVSRPPILGEPVNVAKRGNEILLVSDHRNLGESDLIQKLSLLLPEQTFRIVNAAHHYDGFPNIMAEEYCSDMEAAYAQACLLLVPMYHNDTCGPGRAAIEAARLGVPALGNNRGGWGEIFCYTVPRTAGPNEWAESITFILNHRGEASENAHQAFRTYDTAKQLNVFSNLIESI